MKRLIKSFVSKELIAYIWHLPKAMCAALLNGFPGRRLTIVAVAGTKGKTSTAYFLSSLFDNAKIPNALFCTAALKIAGTETLNTLKLTTPTPFFLQRFLRRAVRAGCTNAILEISSHGISQYRFWGVPLHYVVLTNLVPDHLEYHSSPAEYQQIHQRLITSKLKMLIVNGDDPHCAGFTTLLCPKTITHATDPFARHVVTLNTTLRGSFNKSNLLLATKAAESMGLDYAQLASAIRHVPGAPGRMEFIPNDRGVHIVVDYAHSQQSLDAFFRALREIVPSGRIITVFGACGDRDTSQRAGMGRILDRSSSTIVITSDDPYSEDPETIATQVVAGIASKISENTLHVILDRVEAIRAAIAAAQPEDIVCVLGKGAEQWQIFKHKKIPRDDRAIIKKVLREPNVIRAQT